LNAINEGEFISIHISQTDKKAAHFRNSPEDLYIQK